MFIQGKARRVGDNVNTDQMYPTRYTSIVEDSEMAKHCMEDYDPDLIKRMDRGDVLVAGVGFGCGSSREQAPEVIKALGIPCIIAKSFARIFYRNALNNGLLLLEQPELHDVVKEGDTITVTVNEDVDYNGKKYPIASLPENLMEIIEAGGLVRAMRRRNGLD